MPPSPSAQAVRLQAIALLLFLFSGASGLLYEVVWSRMFATVIGTTMHAVATVLAVFMGGLALGSWLFGRLADRPTAHGLRMYGILELAIGAYALALPLLVDLSDDLFRLAWPWVEDSAAMQLTLRVVLAVLVLLLPSTLMGGTLPVLSRFLVRSRDLSSRPVGLLYGANTLGAVLGVLVAGFFLLENLGVRGTLAVGGTVSATVGLVAVLWSRRLPAGDPLPRPQPSPVVRGEARLALWVFALSGCAALALEVLWTRSLAFFVSVDTWAFSAMLATFLAGLGLGSVLMSPFAPRIRHPLRALALLQLGIGVTAALSVPLFAGLHEVWLDLAAEERAVGSHLVQKLATCSVVMLVPTLLMGMAFPLFAKVYLGTGRFGRSLGTLYALNTVGGIGGSLVAGFALLSWTGIEDAILWVSCAYLVAGAVLLLRTGAARLWLPLPLAAGAALLLLVPTGPVVRHSRHFHERPARRLVWGNEGPAASLAVLDDGPGTTRVLAINGIITAADNDQDMLVHRMLSHLPMLLHPDPAKVLVVGFGMGSTSYGCLQHDVPGVEVVELLRQERDAAPHFAHVNHGVLEDPRLDFEVGDGRNHILASRDQYDVISFNAVHPRFSANLYTRDFYRLCRDRLTERGIVCAWMTQNSITGPEWRGLLGSAVEAFPHTTLWYCNPEHYCLIGSLQPLEVGWEGFTERIRRPGVRDDLADSSIADPYDFAARYLFGGEALREYVAGVPVNTDDLPWVEFSLETQGLAYDIAQRVFERQAPATEVFTFADPGDRDRLLQRQEAMLELMRGEAGFWYRSEPLKDEVHYRRALLLAPESENLRHNLFFSSKMRERIERDMAAHPGQPHHLIRFGRLLRESGRLERAREVLGNAVAMAPKNPHARIQLAIAAALSGDARAVLDALRTVGFRDPGQNPEPFALCAFAQAEALAALGRAEEAAKFRNAALRMAPAVEEWFRLHREWIARRP